MNKVSYVLTMNSEQARELRKAVELLMRLKLGQYEELPFALLDLKSKDFCDKRDSAMPHLEAAFKEFGGGVAYYRFFKKDDEWYRLYNILQVVRHAIQQAEYPESKGVDSYEPMQFTLEPLPKIEVVIKAEGD